MSMADQLLAAQAQLLTMGGTYVDLCEPSGFVKSAMRGAFVNWTVEDEALRNDYDKEAQKFHMEPLAGIDPKRNDFISFSGQRWTILTVHDRIISGQIICHVCVVRK